MVELSLATIHRFTVLLEPFLLAFQCTLLLLCQLLFRVWLSLLYFLGEPDDVKLLVVGYLVQPITPLIQEVKCFAWFYSNGLAYLENFLDFFLNALLVLQVAASCNDCLMLNLKSTLLILGCKVLFEPKVFQRLHLEQLDVKTMANFFRDHFS